MSEEELKEWFWNKFNSCYYVKHDDYPESLFMWYDLNFVRKSKFRILQGKEIIYPTKPIGICLFEQNYENGWFRCDYVHIWSFFQSNLNYNYHQIRVLIKGWLEEYVNLKVLIPIFGDIASTTLLKEYTNFKLLTPDIGFEDSEFRLEENAKLKVLIPNINNHDIQ